MHQLPHTKDSLVPLRRFAVSGLYNIAYLSQLVQRGRLKAKKVGKNYCSTRAWFEKYLELYALDETRIAYKKLFLAVEKENLIEKYELRAVEEKGKLAPFQSKINIFTTKRAMIAVIALFILLSGAYLGFRMFERSGQIAGESEVASSTEERLEMEYGGEAVRFSE